MSCTPFSSLSGSVQAGRTWLGQRQVLFTACHRQHSSPLQPLQQITTPLTRPVKPTAPMAGYFPVCFPGCETITRCCGIHLTQVRVPFDYDAGSSCQVGLTRKHNSSFNDTVCLGSSQITSTGVNPDFLLSLLAECLC